MDEAKWERWAAATGFGFFVLLAVSAFIVPAAPPKASDSIAKITSYLTGHRKAVLISGYLSGLALLFGLWFAGSLRAYLRDAEGAPGRLSNLSFGAALVTAAMALMSTTVMNAAAFRVAGTAGSETVIRAMADLSNIAVGLLWFPAAVWAAATGVVAWQTGAFPKWYAQASLLGAIVFFVGSTSAYVDSGPLQWGGIYSLATFIVFGLWILVSTILLVQRVGTATATARGPMAPAPPM